MLVIFLLYSNEKCYEINIALLDERAKIFLQLILAECVDIFYIRQTA
jgi:hypothetical protein